MSDNVVSICGPVDWMPRWHDVDELPECPYQCLDYVQRLKKGYQRQVAAGWVRDVEEPDTVITNLDLIISICEEEIDALMRSCSVVLDFPASSA